jgi:hypothetical protein
VTRPEKKTKQEGDAMSITSRLRTVAMVGAAAALAYQLVIRPWHRKWGALDEEVQRPLPGDDLVPDAKLSATHAITIYASPAEVWPWLVQMGQGRAGLYSYDWIENLMGLDFHSSDRILPEWQGLKVGDVVPLSPDGFGPAVVALEANRVLLLSGDTRTGGEPAPVLKPGDYLNVSWLFFLEEAEPGATRLIERFRADYNPGLQNSLFYRALLEPGSFIMERKMLLGIKARAESEARSAW